jgi:hypothetical protein
MLRILTGAQAGVRTPFTMPTTKELTKLRDVVLAYYPRFKDDGQDSYASMQLLANCFRGIGALGRLDAVETKNDNVHSIGWWAAHVSDNVRLDGLDYYDFSPNLFALCVLMHGDIPHSIGPRYPHDVVFGLSMGNSNRPATDKWRGLLSGRTPLSASDLPPSMREPPPQHSQVRFY